MRKGEMALTRRVFSLLIGFVVCIGILQFAATGYTRQTSKVIRWTTDQEAAARRGFQIQATTPPFGDDSEGGPYRKVASKAGYRKVEGSITLPTSANAFVVSGEGLWNHVGGTGSNGSEVDAGFTLQPGKNYWFADISAWDAATGQKVYGTLPTLTIPQGTNVFFRFYISPDYRCNLYYQFKDASGVTRSETIYVNNVSGFLQGGSNVYLKRVSSIAQPTAPATNSGSYQLNAAWSNMTLFATTQSFTWTSDLTFRSAFEPTHDTEDPSSYVVTGPGTITSETVGVDTRNY
jgi:hypothetical protein